MNQVEKLISNLCPDGVQVYALGAIGTTVSGLRGKSKEDFSEGNAPYVSYVEIFNNPGLNFVPEKRVKVGSGENQSAIQLGDVLVTGSSETRNECGMTSVVTTEPPVPVYLNSFCFIWRPNTGVELDPQFTKHLFRGRAFRDRVIETANGVTRQNISKPKFLSIEIPVPPIEVQHEVAAILNKFTELEAELEAELQAELEARKSQDVFFRELLLSETYLAKFDSRSTTLGQIGKFIRGKGIQKVDLLPEGLPAIHYGQIHAHYGTSTVETKSFVSQAVWNKSSRAKPGDLIIATTSESVEDVCKATAWLGDSEVAVSADAMFYTHEMDPLFATYFFQSHHFGVNKTRISTGTKVKRISAAKMSEIQIALPQRKVQARIGEALRNLELLTKSMSEGLPAEIAARRQQYEYYRNKLLTFKALEVA